MPILDIVIDILPALKNGDFFRNFVKTREVFQRLEAL